MNAGLSAVQPAAHAPRAPAWLIVLAASAGGLPALRTVLSGLPASLPATLVIAQHLNPAQPSLLARLLGRRTALRVKQAAHGEQSELGTVYVAPPNRHVRVTPAGCLELSDDALVRYQRPAADVLFHSAAAHCAPHLIAVVLSGSGSDGADGVRAIRLAGGHVVVHSPAEAEFGGMPQAAIDADATARVLPVGEIARHLTAWVTPEAPE
ncbi:MAG: chemotaxis protein CheB [Planctomycetota bacterium]